MYIVCIHLMYIIYMCVCVYICVVIFYINTFRVVVIPVVAVGVALMEPGVILTVEIVIRERRTSLSEL